MHVDTHRAACPPGERCRGFLEYALGRLKIAGDLSMPVTNDPRLLASLIREAAAFCGVRPHSLHLSIEIPPGLRSGPPPRRADLLCLLLLGGDLRRDRSGAVRETRIHNREIEDPRGGLYFSRENLHSPDGEIQSKVIEYQFPRLRTGRDFTPLIVALKGFQFAGNPPPVNPFMEGGDYRPDQPLLRDLKRPPPLPGLPDEALSGFLGRVEEGSVEASAPAPLAFIPRTRLVSIAHELREANSARQLTHPAAAEAPDDAGRGAGFSLLPDGDLNTLIRRFPSSRLSSTSARTPPDAREARMPSPPKDLPCGTEDAAEPHAVTRAPWPVSLLATAAPVHHGAPADDALHPLDADGAVEGNDRLVDGHRRRYTSSNAERIPEDARQAAGVAAPRSPCRPRAAPSISSSNPRMRSRRSKPTGAAFASSARSSHHGASDAGVQPLRRLEGSIFCSQPAGNDYRRVRKPLHIAHAENFIAISSRLARRRRRISTAPAARLPAANTGGGCPPAELSARCLPEQTEPRVHGDSGDVAHCPGRPSCSSAQRSRRRAQRGLTSADPREKKALRTCAPSRRRACRQGGGASATRTRTPSPEDELDGAGSPQPFVLPAVRRSASGSPTPPRSSNDRADPVREGEQSRRLAPPVSSIVQRPERGASAAFPLAASLGKGTDPATEVMHAALLGGVRRKLRRPSRAAQLRRRRPLPSGPVPRLLPAEGVGAPVLKAVAGRGRPRASKTDHTRTVAEEDHAPPSGSSRRSIRPTALWGASRTRRSSWFRMGQFGSFVLTTTTTISSPQRLGD